MEEIWKKLEVAVKVEGIRKLRTGREERGIMTVVRLENEEEKRKVMEKKKGLKREDIWIDNDLTWKERKTYALLRKFAR